MFLHKNSSLTLTDDRWTVNVLLIDFIHLAVPDIFSFDDKPIIISRIRPR